LDAQINLVAKELVLQDKRTRSKTTQEFEDEINILKKSNEDEKLGNKTLIENYSRQIKELTDKINMSNIAIEHVIPNRDTFKEIIVDKEIGLDDVLILRKLPKSTVQPIDKVISAQLVSTLLRYEMVDVKNNVVVLNHRGIDFIKFLNTNLDTIKALYSMG
jgi:hypothetical protein